MKKHFRRGRARVKVRERETHKIFNGKVMAFYTFRTHCYHIHDASTQLLIGAEREEINNCYYTLFWKAESNAFNSYHDFLSLVCDCEYEI